MVGGTCNLQVLQVLMGITYLCQVKLKLFFN